MPGKPKQHGAQGRTHLLTPTVREGICETIAMGVTLECAAENEGVSKGTLLRWLRRGRAALEAAENVARDLDPEPTDARLAALIPENERPYAKLVFAVERAQARAEVHFTTRIHAADDWKAAAWWLERRRSGQYGQRSHVTVQQQEPATMSNEELIAELAELGFVTAGNTVPMLPAPATDTEPPPAMAAPEGEHASGE